MLNADVADKARQIETLNADAADKAAQTETLTADAAKAAEEAKATLESEVAKVKDEAQKNLESAVTKAKEEAQGTIDGLTKQIEELTKSMDFANLDEEGIMNIVKKMKDNPKVLELIPDIIKEFGGSLLGGSTEAAE